MQEKHDHGLPCIVLELAWRYSLAASDPSEIAGQSFSHSSSDIGLYPTMRRRSS